MVNVIRLVTLFVIILVAQVVGGMVHDLTGSIEVGQSVGHGVSLLGGIVYSKLIL